LQVAIEATIAPLKRPFNDDQVPVRSQFRLSSLMIGSAAMVNIRCIQRYLAARQHPGKPEPTTSPFADNSTNGAKPSTHSSLFSAWARLRRSLWPNQDRRAPLALAF
jgi:hypothetical protein